MVVELFSLKLNGSFRMKTTFLILFLVSTSFALSINDSLLKIHATLLPKVYLMDYNFKNKIQNKTIVIAILYSNTTYQSAKSLKEKIEARYPNGINKYKIVSKLVSYKKLATTQANIFYMLPASHELIEKSVKYAQKELALTFAYDKKDLNYGVMISLNISKKIKPILNLKALKINEIEMRPMLINISLIFTYSKSSIIERMQHESFNFIQVYSA